MAGRRHVTSAYDVALISRYGYTLPMFEQLVSTYGPYRVRVGTRDEREFWNRNSLLRFYEGANGIKTGYTREAGYCLAASAVRDDLHLIAVVLGAVHQAGRGHPSPFELGLSSLRAPGWWWTRTNRWPGFRGRGAGRGGHRGGAR